MMFPTTVLSVLAVSAAAENTSSGNRGLRKSSTPWTAIAVVSGTAVIALGAGVGIGAAIWANSCPTGQDCKPTKCSITAYLKTAAAGKTEAECVSCTGNTQLASAELLTAAPNSAAAAQCANCTPPYYPKTLNKCDGKCEHGLVAGTDAWPKNAVKTVGEACAAAAATTTTVAP